MMREFDMNENLLKSFEWDNQSEAVIKNDSILIKAHPHSDYFNDPADSGAMSKNNAPFYFTKTQGDFILKAKVSHSFKSVYDACTLMVKSNDRCWAKLCFELTDFGTNAVVSVVTNGVSDDANGSCIDVESVWLQVARVGKNFAFHYSLDGKKFDMVRLCTLPVGVLVKIGVQAQSPHGDGGERGFYGLTIERRTVDDLRVGV